MKVRIEYKRAPSNKTWLWTFAFQLHDLDSSKYELVTFETQHKTLNGALNNFSKFLRDNYRKTVEDVSILKRISPQFPIGVGMVRVSDAV